MISIMQTELYLLGRYNSGIETHLINGIQRVGIIHQQDLRNALPSDQIKRRCNCGMFLNNDGVTVTSRHEALIFEQKYVILKRFN